MQIPFRAPSQSKQTSAPSCHGPAQVDTGDLPLVVIVGSPNVGKSVLFNKLTGAYVTVSNYPGTTVEVSRGKGRVGDVEVGVVDTPGMYGLLPITEEERVGRRILFEEQPRTVVHVVDAKNLERMLPMTLQLIEVGLPVILAVNLMDEAERLGIDVDAAAIEQALGVPVVATALLHGRGLAELQRAIGRRLRNGTNDHAKAPALSSLSYPATVETSTAAIAERLNGSWPLAGRAMALLLLQDDEEVASWLDAARDDNAHESLRIAAQTREQVARPIPYLVLQEQRRVVRDVLSDALRLPAGVGAGRGGSRGIAARLSEATINPWTGIPILLLVLFVLYQFVGVLGAQTLVGFLEETVFGAYINPWVDRVLATLIPWAAVRSLIGGEYGVITLGLRYSVALILPIVGTFFIAFSIIEDSGYLPRLALLVDRVFKRIGLNGRAVIPMVLGFGCDTMATVVTRTLETRRERLISTVLLSLAIPCSAQLGVLLGLLAGQPAYFIAWAAIVGGVFLLVGFLAARLMPGEQPTFYMELPPLRLPSPVNVLVKTYTRMEWYLREVLPMFVLASVLIWVGQLTGLFDVIVGALVPVMRWIGLPDDAAVSFLFGFFRRDYGAAGLYDMRGVMTGAQLLVATTTLTLFVPCIAQFSVTIKERGWKTAVAISAFIFPFAFVVGALLYRVLLWLGVAG